MARPLRIAFQGATYHITLRGNGRQDIFRTDRDRVRFLESLQERVELFQIRLYAYCLMTNHVHLVCETPLANISAFMQSLQTSYTTYFNKKHQRVGHVVQGRFGDKLVEQGNYLLRLCRYVHLNPVFTKDTRALPHRERVATLRAYPWSSYRGYIGQTPPSSFIDYQPMLDQVASRTKRAGAEYRRFVETGLAKGDESLGEALKASPFGIGSEAFLQDLSQRHAKLAESHKRKEEVAFRRGSRTISPEDVLETAGRILEVEPNVFKFRQRNSWLRAIAVKMLCTYSGLSQRGAADFLAMGSGAAASMQLKQLQAELRHDEELRTLVEGVDDELRKLIT